MRKRKPTTDQHLERCLTWVDSRSKKRLYSFFQFPFGRIILVPLGDLSIQRQLSSRIYQGKKTSVGYQRDDQESRTTRFRILLPPIQQQQENSCMRIFKQGDDSPTISNNINALVQAKGKLQSLSKEITEQGNGLFMTINGLCLQPGNF